MMLEDELDVDFAEATFEMMLEAIFDFSFNVRYFFTFSHKILVPV